WLRRTDRSRSWNGRYGRRIYPQPAQKVSDLSGGPECEVLKRFENQISQRLIMKITHLAIALGLAFVSTEARAEKLVIKGSDTLGAKLVPQLAEQFKAQHPGTTFD